MTKRSILLIALLFSASVAFAQEEPAPDKSSKFNGAIPAIGVGVVVAGLTATYLMSDDEEEELEFMLMLNESTEWMEEHTVPDERGLSFKLFEW